MTRSNAKQVIGEEITNALQSRIAEWQAERAKIEPRIANIDRVQARYELLGELIAEAESEVSRLMKGEEQIGDRR